MISPQDLLLTLTVTCLIIRPSWPARRRSACNAGDCGWHVLDPYLVRCMVPVLGTRTCTVLLSTGNLGECSHRSDITTTISLSIFACSYSCSYSYSCSCLQSPSLRNRKNNVRCSASRRYLARYAIGELRLLSSSIATNQEVAIWCCKSERVGT